MSTKSPELPAEVRPTFDEVFRNELPYVLRLVRRLGVPPGHCEDAAQDVFLVVYERLPEYEPRGKLRGWLGAIAFRVASRSRSREARLIPTEIDPQDDGLDVLGEIASAEEVERVLDDVPPVLAFLFIQHHFYDVSVPDLAEQTGAGLNTTKKRLHIARREVRAAWLRYKAREHHEGRSNVVPILGPLTFLEAGRQIPEVPDSVRARVWQGVQERIHGGGGPSSRPPGMPRSLPVALARPRVVAILAGLGGLAVGVGIGAAWDPLHRPAPTPVHDGGDPQTPATGVVVQVMPATIPASPVRAPSPTTEAAEAVPSSLPAASPPAPASSAAMTDLDVVLVERAEAALRTGDVDAAIAAAQQHAGTFHGGGRRAHDRDVVWIAALVRAGRTEEARRRLVSFARAYPRSPRLEDFRRTLGDP